MSSRLGSENGRTLSDISWRSADAVPCLTPFALAPPHALFQSVGKRFVTCRRQWGSAHVDVSFSALALVRRIRRRHRTPALTALNPMPNPLCYLCPRITLEATPASDGLIKTYPHNKVPSGCAPGLHIPWESCGFLAACGILPCSPGAYAFLLASVSEPWLGL